MVIGGFAFAAMRKAPLPLLLFLSTLAVGVSYLGLAAAPSLLVACVASVIGGSGNGVQWVGVISAVQELTGSSMQARVLGVLESVAAAMPGVGFAVGGLIAAVSSPRVTFLVAGLGVLAILAIAAPILGSKWTDRLASFSSNELDGDDDIVLELIPGSRSPIQSDPEVSS
jgi:MFS family permease